VARGYKACCGEHLCALEKARNHPLFESRETLNPKVAYPIA